MCDVAPTTALADLVAHLDHGWVYSSPTAFGMALVKDHSWDDEALADPEIYCLPEEGDCWYFTRIAGNVAEVISRLPFPLERCAWHRHRGEMIKTVRHDFRKLCRQFGAFPTLLRSQPGTIGFHAIERREQTQGSADRAGHPDSAAGPIAGQ